MPKSAKHFALARQWQMLNLIPTRAPGISAAEITLRLAEEGFAVSKRTVERDLNELSRQFGLATHSTTRSTANGWYFAAGRGHDLGGVELADAVSLVLAGDVLARMLPAPMLQAVAGKIEQARDKLKSVRGHPFARWSEKVRFVPPTLNLCPPHINRKVMETVQQALVEEQQLDVRYAPFNEKPKQMTLHPLSLILRGSVPYLVATVFNYGEVRLFALHRVETVRMLEAKALVPAGYAVDDYIHQGGMEFGSGDPLALRAVVSKELAMYLSETPLSNDQKVTYRKEQWQLTATVRDTWQLQFWVLSQGDAIQITGPKALRSRIRDILEAAVGHYHQAGA